MEGGPGEDGALIKFIKEHVCPWHDNYMRMIECPGPMRMIESHCSGALDQGVTQNMLTVECEVIVLA